MLNKLLANRYQIIKFLGSGGFGQTYIAEDTHRPGNPTCVVKHLKPINSQTSYLEAARRFFNQEAQALEKMGNYPQIPRLLAYFAEDNQFYLVQEFIEGNLLSLELASGSCWSENQVVQLLQEILEILHFIHCNGVIHRDLKPTNIIRRREDNKLVLIDFGIVKEISMQLGTAQSQMTTSVIMGTAGYMSPEQARGKPRFSSDIYSLGVIAIQAITGLRPKKLQEDTKGEIDWQSHTQASPQLAKILSGMVRYHFQERYKSAQEVLDALQSFTVSPGIATSQRSPLLKYPPTEPPTESTTAPFHGISSGTSKSNVVYSSGQNSHSGNKAINCALPTVPNFNLLHSGLGFVKTFKSPMAVAVGIINLTAILGVFGLDWYKNQNFLTNVAEVKSLKKQKEYSKCIEKADKVSLPRQSSLSYSQTKTELIATVNECLILQAKLLAQQGNFAQAITTANKLPNNQPFSQDSQELINTWSQQLIEKAQQKYENLGDMDGAIITLKDIPSTSFHYRNVQELKEQWQQQNNTNKEYLKVAQRALMQNRYKDAIATVNKIYNTPYWNIKKEGIIQEAKSGIKQDIAKSSNASIKTISRPITSIQTTNILIPVTSVSTPKAITRVIKVKTNNSSKIVNQDEKMTNDTIIDNCQDSQSIFGQGSNCSN